MDDFNKWVGTGYMVSAPERKQTRNGKEYARFRMAVNQGWGDQKKTTFLTCQVWGKPAEFVLEYGDKGRKVLIEGELNILEKKDGDNYNTSVFMQVRTLRFLDFIEKGGSSKREDPMEKAYGGSKAEPADDSFEDEEIPF